MRGQDHSSGYYHVATDHQGLQGAPRPRGRNHDDDRRMLHLDAQDDLDGPSSIPNSDHEVSDVPRGHLLGDCLGKQQADGHPM